MGFSHSARQSMYVFSGTLLSRVLGFVRVALIATTLGLTRLNDSYTIANVAPNMMYELILGSLIASVLVPFFVQQYKRKDSQADKALMSFVGVSSLLLTLITIACAPLIADVMTHLNNSDSASAQRELVIVFLYFFLPQIFFYALTAAVQAYLSARRRFIAAAFAPILNNVIVIGTVLYVRSRSSTLNSPLADLSSSNTVRILALGTTLGVVIVAVVLLITFFINGGRFGFSSLRSNDVRVLISRSKWMALYAVANQITLFLIIAFANSRAGGVSAYNTAFTYFQLPHGLLAVTIMTTMVPRITHTMDESLDTREITTTPETATTTRQTSTGLLIAMCSVASAIVAIAVPTLVLLTGHGKITDVEAEHIGRVLIGFMIFLPAFSLYLLVVRIATAMGKTREMFFINVAQNSLNIVLALLLRNHFGVVGLSVAFSLSYCLVIPFSLRTISRQLSSSVLEKHPSFVMIGFSAIAAAAGYWISISVDQRIAAIFAGGFTCVLIQLIGVLLVRKQLRELARLVYRRRAVS